VASNEDGRPGTASGRVGRVAVALIAGLALGIGVASTGQPALIRAVGFLEPVGAIWVNAIRMTVVPLVIALLLAAIARGSDVRVGRLGGLAFGGFLALHLVAALFALLIVPPLLSSLPVDAAAAAQLRADAGAATAATVDQVRALPTFGQWFASLAPANVVRAAADGAMLPLIVFTVLFGLALRRITDERRAFVLRVFDGIGGAMLEIVRWLIIAAPIGVFALVAPMAARLGLSLAGALGYYVLAYVGAMIALTIVLSVAGALGGGVSPLRFARAALPAQAVAFSSSSSLASLPALVDSSARLGVPTALGGFVLPLAVSSFKVATSLAWLVGTLFLARLYGVPLGAADQLTIVAAAVALSFATPGVPNGGFLLLAPVLASVGLPASGVALLIAIDAIPDLFATTTNVTGDFAAVSIVRRLAAREAVVDGVTLPGMETTA
jgi:Na+/H+-dicarboxylate symporter